MTMSSGSHCLDLKLGSLIQIFCLSFLLSKLVPVVKILSGIICVMALDTRPTFS
jgi:hypothetical protein